MRPSPSVEDRWVWVLGSHDSFSIISEWETIRPHSSRFGWSGLLWGGEIFLSTPFVLGWPSGIGWVLEIG